MKLFKSTKKMEAKNEEISKINIKLKKAIDELEDENRVLYNKYEEKNTELEEAKKVITELEYQLKDINELNDRYLGLISELTAEENTTYHLLDSAITSLMHVRDRMAPDSLSDTDKTHY